jgi:KaiC/GvpD/RAD55 family RecA-like ATPase
MNTKTRLGIPFFDDVFGGVYRGWQTLCHGRAGSGKSIFGMHFINQALAEGDRALFLSENRVADTLKISEQFGMPFAAAMASGQLTLLEYGSFITEKVASSHIMLPPQAFDELQDMIDLQSIRRVVLDTVLPWVAIQPVSHLEDHIYSFIHALDRIGVTVLMTLPKPVSKDALILKNHIEDLCSVSINLDHVNQTERCLSVIKYIGQANNLSSPIACAIQDGIGFVRVSPDTSDPTPASAGPPDNRSFREGS